MDVLTPRITRQRLLGAAAVLLIASVLAWLVGIDMAAFGLGLLIGLVIVGAVAAISILRARRRQRGSVR